MTFERSLKILCEVADISLKQIAITVGYEKSYISKWYNGKNLPSRKKIEVIIKEISEFVASNIKDENLSEIINYYPHLVDIMYKMSKEELIANILWDGYIFSIKSQKFNKQKIYKRLDSTPAIILNENVGDKLASIINNNINESSKSNDIYADFDFFEYMTLDFVKQLEIKYTKYIPFKFNCSFIEDDPDYILKEKIIKYFMAASKMYFMDIQLYKSKPNNERIIAMQNNFTGFGIQIDDKNLMHSLTYTTDKNMIKNNFLLLENKFDGREKLIESQHSFKEAEELLKKDTKAEKSIFVMPYLHPGLAGLDFMDYLKSQNREHSLCEETKSMLNLMFEAGKRTKIILFKSAIDKLNNDNEIGYYSYSTKLYKGEKQKYLEGIKDNANKHNAEVYIYDDTKADNIMSKLVIYTTKENAIYMKAESNFYPELGIFFRSRSKKISNIIFNILNNLKIEKI